MLEIIEIIGPAKQGKTKPYICRGEDDAIYYVKGKNSGRRSQCCEWLAGSLAVAFGLPVAPFKQVHISDQLLAEASKDWQEIGAGVAFASTGQEAYWFEPSWVARVPKKLRQDVLAFDWWVKNMDRLEDNPNLLWSDSSGQLVVIDYGLSFDADCFFPTAFQGYHVFSQDSAGLFCDLANQAEYAKRFSDALVLWPEACRALPPEWVSAPSGHPDDALDLNVAREILNRCLADDLWRME